MKITFIGTGTMGSITRCNTSLLVDDILFDIGMGTVKQIERLKIYTKNIKYLAISHFHSDHFLDVPNLLFGRSIRGETENKLVIIGSIGVRKKIVDLMNFTQGNGDDHKYDDLEERFNVEVIELKDKQKYYTDAFNITTISLNHGECIPTNGYLLKKEGKVISYACDTTFCDNYYKMCEISDYMFSDVTRLETSNIHIGLDDYKELYKKYPNCKFYAIHRSDYDTNGVSNVYFPDDGDVLKI